MPTRDLNATSRPVLDDLYLTFQQVLTTLLPDREWRFVYEVQEQDGFPVLIFRDYSNLDRNEPHSHYSIKIKGPEKYEMWSWT